jgi:hypothetical protein
LETKDFERMCQISKTDFINRKTRRLDRNKGF